MVEMRVSQGGGGGGGDVVQRWFLRMLRLRRVHCGAWPVSVIASSAKIGVAVIVAISSSVVAGARKTGGEGSLLT